VSTAAEKTANIAAAVSIPAWLASFVTDWLPVMQFLSGLLAAVASLIVIVPKLHAWWLRWRQR
jgi:hypothetical protein